MPVQLTFQRQQAKGRIPMTRQAARMLPRPAATANTPAQRFVACATDEERLRPGLGALLESLIGGLAAKTAVRAVVVVEVLPLPQLVVEDLGVVDHHAV
jgi:hypothetical protein